MLHSYFRLKNKHYNISSHYKFELPSDTDDLLLIKSRLSKQNESQFLFILTELLNRPLDIIDMNTLNCFFIHLESQPEDFTLPFQDPEPNEISSNKFIPETYVVLNCKKKLQYLVDHYMDTKEYGKDTHINKLLVLLDYIYRDVLQLVIINNYKVSNYIDDLDEIIDMKRFIYINDIRIALDHYTKYIQELCDNITNKITSLSKPNVSTENFSIEIDSFILKKIYFGLEQEMFINQEKTTCDQFLDVLLLDWESHNSIIYLEMDNILFKYFIESLETYFNTKIQLSTIEYSAKITNKNGIIKASAIYSSMAQYRKFTKERDDIKTLKSMFEKIKNH